MISFFLAKFSCVNLAVKFSDFDLLNYRVVIYLLCSVVILLSISLIFVLLSLFLTKLLVPVVLILLTFLTNSLYSVFLTISFSLHYLAYSNQME